MCKGAVIYTCLRGSGRIIGVINFFSRFSRAMKFFLAFKGAMKLFSEFSGDMKIFNSLLWAMKLNVVFVYIYFGVNILTRA